MAEIASLTPRTYSVRHLAYGVFLIFTFLAAYILGTSGLLNVWIGYGGSALIVLAFFAGLFFTSFATIGISVVMIIALAKAGMPLHVLAVVGGIGAMFGDAGILKTLKWSLLDDLYAYILQKTKGDIVRAVEQRWVRILSLVVGALVIASPLPDEVGLAMMGLTQLPTRYIMLTSFVLNAIGILVIGLATR